ncbi:MAG TPA: sulfite exporter TauE/SafE family protein [Bacillota bacterium]|nr:sulfite exporter TauE/SafE family protein [Bacillota bacterium]HPT86815.1 sulfite exporter TauE/SafE family protein [Bacillota bacterium]
MNGDFDKKVFTVKGMSCSSCVLKLENGLKKQTGIKSVQVSLRKAQAVVEYDPAIITIEDIVRVIEDLGYESCLYSGNRQNESESRKFSVEQLLGLGIIIFLLYHLINSTVGFNFIPVVDQKAGYGMLFLAGLLTSVHCIAMCGGINISQCIQGGERFLQMQPAFSKFRPSLLYNAGRVISYTLIGGAAGALGSVVSFSGSAKGMVAVLAGFLMMIIGINMLGIFPWLKRFNVPMPRLFGNKLFSNGGRYGPFVVGLLNGLMPCGPLQTMQLYALGTGSFRAGALSMFLFSLGTVPLMFGFGAISSLLSQKLTRPMLRAGAVLVIVLGLVMVSRGLSLSGVSVAPPGPVGSKAAVAVLQGGVQEVTTTLTSGRYTPIIVQKGIPVRWTIKATAEDLNGCNNPIIIPKYGMEKRLVPGDNFIEFTPQEEGNLTYTCWMGMIRSTIKVVSDLTKVSDQDLSSVDPGNSNGVRGSCCSTGF